MGTKADGMSEFKGKLKKLNPFIAEREYYRSFNLGALILFVSHDRKVTKTIVRHCLIFTVAIWAFPVIIRDFSGSGLRIFFNVLYITVLIGFYRYATVPKRILKEKAKEVAKQYEAAVAKDAEVKESSLL